MATMEKTNRAVERLAENTRDSYQTVVDHAVGLQERNVRFAQGIVDGTIKELRHQAESNRSVAGELFERAGDLSIARLERERRWLAAARSFDDSARPGQAARILERIFASTEEPVMRADVAMHENYHPPADRVLHTPITSIRGTDDALVSATQAGEWAAATTAGCDVVEISGGHMYLADAPLPLVRLIANILAEQVGTPQTLEVTTC